MYKKQKGDINHSSSYYYWANIIKNKSVHDMFIGTMGNRDITEESVLVYLAFMDGEKEIFKSGWSVHRDLETFIGYMRHVWFPTAFYTWLDREKKGFFIPVACFEDVRGAVMMWNEDEEDREDAKAMESLLAETASLYGKDRTCGIAGMKAICETLNAIFDNGNDRKLYIEVFGHSSEIVDFIAGDEAFPEVVEEEIGMTIDELNILCSKVYTEALINRTFINHLNQEIPIWF